MQNTDAAREKGETHVLQGYFVCCDTRERPGLYLPHIVGSYIYFKTTQIGWQLARVVGIAADAKSMSLPHTTKMLDLGKQYNVHLSASTLSTISEERGAWCWYVHRRTRSVKNYTPSLEYKGCRNDVLGWGGGRYDGILVYSYVAG